jgi:hypothetical protein
MSRNIAVRCVCTDVAAGATDRSCCSISGRAEWKSLWGASNKTTALQKLSHETNVSDNRYLLPVLTGFLFQHEYNEMINNETNIEMEFISTECGVFFDYGI